ncbi:hypothetical protein GY45DRAFT_206162 [Cubamyces sp. BRFM 1775]|nr:hypothetical protein GY45DRAFT_206162 [Cubamyces sp. BRFM 1775]
MSDVAARQDQATRPGCFEPCKLQDSDSDCLNAVQSTLYPRTTDPASYCSRVNGIASQLLRCVAPRCEYLEGSISTAISYCQSYATLSDDTYPTTTSLIQPPPPVTPISQPSTQANSPSAAQSPSSVLTTTSSEPSSIPLTSPDGLNTGTLPTTAKPLSPSDTVAYPSGTLDVKTIETANSDITYHHTSPPSDTGLAHPTSTHTGSGTAKHDTHLPVTAVALAVLFLVLLVALYLCVRLGKRYRVGTQSTILQKADHTPESSSETLFEQCIFGDGMERHGTPSAASSFCAESIDDPRQDVLTPDRPVSSIEDRPLLRHITELSFPLSLTAHTCLTGGCVGHGDNSGSNPDGDNTKSRCTGKAYPTCAMRDSWDSDGDSEDLKRVMTDTSKTVTGWHPSRMVRPSSNSYNVGPAQEDNMVSSDLATHRDTMSYTFESGETGLAM